MVRKVLPVTFSNSVSVDGGKIGERTQRGKVHGICLQRDKGGGGERCNLWNVRLGRQRYLLNVGGL